MFFDHYSEALDARTEILKFGEFFPAFATIYVLREDELTHLKKHGYYTDRVVTEDTKQKKKKKFKKIVIRKEPKEKPLPRRNRKGGKAAASAKLEEGLFCKRFPEDEVVDDYESGQMTCWKVLGLDVPLTTIQVNEFDDQEELKEDEIDLKRVVKTLQPISKVSADEIIRKEEAMYDKLGNFDDGFLRDSFGKKRTILQQMSDAKAMSSIVKAGGDALFSFVSGVHSKLGATEVRWKVCKYAEILLSTELRHSVQNYKWNVDAYLEFNRLSSKLQGEVAQQLAFACNFGPPEGFARISNWTRAIVPAGVCSNQRYIIFVFTFNANYFISPFFYRI
jgi:hypothetical protein